MSKKITLLFVSFLFTSIAFSQSLKSPKEYLGYELGTRFTRHHKVVEYFQYVASQMGNVKVEKYGETYEHRDLIVAVLTSPDNFKNLEEIRANNLKLARIEEGAPTSNKKAIVWLSYNVHGNESVSMEASMQTLFDLVDPNNAKSKKWLENTVVIIDPCINPDGRDRYANFYNQYQNSTPNPDPNSMEHNEPWPGGRANHYLFDLNRDWAWLKQAESQQRLKKYHEWMPMVHVDFHEQGMNSPYYMAPAAEPFHELITNWQREFQTTIGKNNATYFDKNNWLYFTRQRFDLLYPSYGDTYPTYNGAIGMTYEQGGGGRGGLTVTTEMGDELTLVSRISHHHSNGLSTVEVTSQNADRVINEFEKYFKTAPSNSKYKSFVIKGTNHPDKLAQLASLLDQHKISYGNPVIGKKAVSGFDYQSGTNKSVNLTANDLIINVDQSKATLISVLFEPQTYYSDSLTYDITAWSVPYAYGLDAMALTESVSQKNTAAYSHSSSTKVEEKAYAYFIPYTSFQSAKFLAYLQSAGLKIRSAGMSFSDGTRTYQPGTLIVTQRNNEHLSDEIAQILNAGSSKFNVPVYSTTTGFMSSGVDVGSGDVHYIKAPKVALLGGSGSSSLSFGETWYFMEQELGYQVSTIDTEDFSRVNLDGYDVLIVPNGYYSLFSENTLKKVKEWVQGGGRLIAIGNALNSFVDKDGFGLTKYASEDEKKKAEETDKRDPLQKYGNSEREGISEEIIGAIYKVNLDNTHPLAYGYGTTYFTLKTSANKYAWLKDDWNVGTLPKNAKAVAGFVGNKAQQDMSESLLFGVQDMGRGQIVYMVDNPLFRAFWENGKLLMSNAIFMVGQ